MAYTVSLSGSAEADAYAAFEYIREVAPASAARWLTGLFAAMRTLADMPARCPVIPEAEEVGRPLRHWFCRKFCSECHTGAVTPVCAEITRRESRTVRPQ